MSNQNISRRSAILSLSQLSAVFLSASLLSACENSSQPKTQDDISIPIIVQLSWLHSTGYAGEIIAKINRYYHLMGLGPIKLEGISDTKGPGINQLMDGRALIHITEPYNVALANSVGADLRIIAIIYQKNPMGLLVNKSSHIKKPADLRKKIIAVQESKIDLFHTFLRFNKIKPTMIKIIVVDPNLEQLALRKIDGIVSYATEHSSFVHERKIDTNFLYFSDFGLEPIGQCVAVRNSSIDKDYERLTKFLAADIQGWKIVIEEPEQTVQLLRRYSSITDEPNYEDQLYQVVEQIPYINTELTKTQGLLTMDPDIVNYTVEKLNVLGINCTVKSLFNDALIKEVYQTHPELLQ